MPDFTPEQIRDARTTVPRLIAALRLACNSGLPTEVWAEMTKILEGRDE